MTENPNDILLTEDGHPIGEVVLADNSSLPQFPPQRMIEEENKEELLRQMDLFADKFKELRDALEMEDSGKMKQMMRLSTERRSYFDK